MSTLSLDEKRAAYKAFQKRQRAESWVFKCELGLCGEVYCKDEPIAPYVRCQKHLDMTYNSVVKVEKRKKKEAVKAAKEAEKARKRNERILASALRGLR